ncbi:hypothetical protein [Absidia glauca]|uniref:Uncharacterized protein n=1 Tax=Absidia glauca TaxID=4829 RepID=A0A163MRG3_ABSGL|nr:hypothetical protein [Absidia glauca]
MIGFRTFFLIAISIVGLSMAAESPSFDQTVLSRWQTFESSLNTNTNLKQVQRQWTLFADALEHQYPSTAVQLDQVKQLTRHYKSVTQWQTLADSIQTKLDLPSTPTRVSHDNQATW